MTKFSLSMVLFLIVITITFGQENERHITKELENLEKLIRKGDFVNGHIFLTDDTLQTKLLTFRGTKKMNYNLFCVAKDNKDSIKIYRPVDIVGYRMKGMNFISRNSNEESFFLKQLKTGKIDLFEKRSTPSENRTLYFLRFPNKADFYVIDPEANNITIHRFPSNSQSGSNTIKPFFVQTKGIHEKFKIFVGNHLRDCPKVVFRVKADFYTINDILDIVEAYNNCFD